MEKEEALKKLGNRIREIRQEKGMTQLQLGHAVDKDQQSIQRLEAGNMNPTYYYLKQITVGLGISIKELFKEE
jgi:putative transcriptional regulator